MEAQVGAFIDSQRTGVNAHLRIATAMYSGDTVTFTSTPWFEMHFHTLWIALNKHFPMHTWSLALDPHANGLSFSLTVTLTLNIQKKKKELWRKVAEERFPDYLFLFDLSEATASAVLKEKGMHLEVTQRDGKEVNDGYGDKMIDHTRVRVYVEAGKVVGIDSVGY